jgi:hypothetical protein
MFSKTFGPLLNLIANEVRPQNRAQRPPRQDHAGYKPGKASGANLAICWTRPHAVPIDPAGDLIAWARSAPRPGALLFPGAIVGAP